MECPHCKGVDVTSGGLSSGQWLCLNPRCKVAFEPLLPAEQYHRGARIYGISDRP